MYFFNQQKTMSQPLPIFTSPTGYLSGRGAMPTKGQQTDSSSMFMRDRNLLFRNKGYYANPSRCTKRTELDMTHDYLISRKRSGAMMSSLNRSGGDFSLGAYSPLAEQEQQRSIERLLYRSGGAGIPKKNIAIRAGSTAGLTPIILPEPGYVSGKSIADKHCHLASFTTADRKRVSISNTEKKQRQYKYTNLESENSFLFFPESVVLLPQNSIPFQKS